MRKLLIILLIFISSYLNAQVHTLPVFKYYSRLTDSVTVSGVHQLTIDGRDTSIRVLGNLYLSSGSINLVSGNYKMNGSNLSKSSFGIDTTNYLLKANNLSDLASISTAKTNLSLNNVENTALSTWAGTTNITTLGTIGTGTWNGSLLTGTYGGTGVNNGSKTITLGNNFTTSGNFALTLTQTNTTNVTLPTTGTLSTLAGSETLTNKTINGSSNTLVNIRSFTIPLISMVTASPADSTIYYSGGLAAAASTTAGNRRLYIPVTATLIAVYINPFAGTVGSGQYSQLDLVVNGSTTVNLSNTVVFTANNNPFSVTGLSQTVNAGEYVETKLTTGNWTPTNPASIAITGTLYFIVQ